MNPEQLQEWKNAIIKEDRNITNFENFNFDVLYSIFEDCIADGIETRESVLDIINFIKEERYKIIDLDNILKKSKQYWLYAEFEFPTMQKALESKQLYFTEIDRFEFFYNAKSQNLLASNKKKLPLYRDFLKSCFNFSEWRHEYGIELYSRPYFKETILPWIECVDTGWNYIARRYNVLLMEEKLKKNESEKLICEASEKPKWEKSETIICDESEKTKCEASEKNETLKCEESEKTISEASEKNETLKCEESEKPISEASEKPKCEKSETIKSEKSEKPISEKNEKPKDEETLNNTPSKEEEDIIIKLKANLLKEGFFELPKVKELNDEVRQKLLWILSSHIRNSENWDTTIPFKLALFDYLGFIVHLNQQYNSKVMKMYHKMKEILDYKDDSTIRKEWPTKRKNKYQEENPYKNKANEFFLT